MSSPMSKKRRRRSRYLVFAYINNPKIGRDDAYWTDICNGLAAGKTPSELGLKRGWRPGAKPSSKK
eukprot:scaffold535_cov163-Skeletonema_menzelii.AAC.2